MTIKEKLALMKRVKDTMDKRIVAWCEEKTQNMTKVQYREKAIKVIRSEWSELNKLAEREEQLAVIAKRSGKTELADMHIMRAKNLINGKCELVDIFEAVVDQKE